MAQECEYCKYGDHPTADEPCHSCEWNELDKTFSNFTAKKDLNQLLREKLGYVEPPKIDMVKQPSHYMLKPGLEVRDVIELLVGKIYCAENYPPQPMVVADYVQMMQYLMRFMEKNGKQDLEKAKWYLDKLIEAYE